jgi:hypothetical protein
MLSPTNWQDMLQAQNFNDFVHLTSYYLCSSLLMQLIPEISTCQHTTLLCHCPQLLNGILCYLTLICLKIITFTLSN